MRTADRRRARGTLVLVALLALIFGAPALTTAQVITTSGVVCPISGLNLNPGQLCYRIDTGQLFMLTGTNVWAPIGSVTTAGLLALGPGGTALTNGIVRYTPSLTPSITSAAIQTTEQAFTVSGVAVGDVIFVNGPTPTSLCPLVTARVSALNTVALGFTTLTAVACTPAAGTYNIFAIR